MAAAPCNNLVTTVCDNVISLTESQMYAIVNNVWARLSDFQGFNYDRIQTWVRKSKRLPALRGRCYFGSVAMEKIQGISYLANHMLLHEHSLVCDGFDAAMMRQSMDDAKIHYAESKQETAMLKPRPNLSMMNEFTENKVLLLILLLRKV